MEVTLMQHRESFELLPAIMITRMRKQWLVDISWGTVTLEIEIRRKNETL